VRWILDTYYDDVPDGVPGNDDEGELNAWAVWACLGLYPLAATPGGTYVLTSPCFADATVGAGTIHVTSGLTFGQTREARDAFFENFFWASHKARLADITLLIEPLNAVDRPGYFVSRSDDVVALLGELGCENVKLLFDVYHIQIMEGDLLRRLERHWPHVGHVQIASVPRRHEPDEGEVAFAAILADLTARDYQGFVGAEYNPRGSTQEGLGWAAPWLGR
jgi:hydroxypyruvate isomerase